MAEVKKSMHVLLAGGSGWIAQNVTRHLHARGHTVTRIDRSRAGKQHLVWTDFGTKANAITLAKEKANKAVDSVVVLTGAPIIDKSWTAERKQELTYSRVNCTKTMVDQIFDLPEQERPSSFISGSAVGVYPSHKSGGPVYDELYKGPFGTDFGAELCQAWEAASAKLDTDSKVRRVIVRTGIVMGPDGGALPQMLIPGGFFSLGKCGDGAQPYPWIHIDDLARMFVHGIETEIAGVMNGAAPQQITQAQFADALAKATNRWAVPLPEFAVKMMFQERASMLLEGAYMDPKPNTSGSNFQFNFPDISSALENVASKL